MKLLDKLPLRLVQWLLQEYLPDVDDTDYTPEQLINYDPRGPFADNLNDMGKAAAVAALSRIIDKLTPFTMNEAAPHWWNWRHLVFNDKEFDEREQILRESHKLEYHEETRGLNGSYDEYIDEHSDADPGL